jgi:hypothetical protein
MRRTLAAVPLIGLTLISACGSSSSSSATPASTASTGGPSATATVSASDFGSVLRAAVTKNAGSSSKIALTVITKSSKADVSVTGTGVLGKNASGPLGDITIKLMNLAIEEKIVGGKIYLKVPTQADYYVLPLTKLAGTSLATASSPADAANLLLAAGKTVTKVGTVTVRGVSTTHYKGTIAVDPSSVTGAAQQALIALAKTGVISVPFDAYVDAQGHLVRLTEMTTLKTAGIAATVSTTLDQFDFGTPISVTAATNRLGPPTWLTLFRTPEIKWPWDSRTQTSGSGPRTSCPTACTGT